MHRLHIAALLALGLAFAFPAAAQQSSPAPTSEVREFERMTYLHLGALMLARIDGKSPVEYIRDDDTKDKVRRAAKRILCERPRSLEDVITALGEGAEG